MATYTRLPAVPSKEISEVVVRSFENLTDENNNFDYSELEKTITSAIIKANEEEKQLAKMKGTSSNLDLSRTRTTSMMDRVEKKIDANLDKFFKELNTFSNNPLKGVSDTIDNGFKGFFNGINRVWNTSIGDVVTDVKESKLVKSVGNFATSVAGGFNAISKGDDLAYLLKEEQEQKIEKKQVEDRESRKEETQQAQLVEQRKTSIATTFISTTIGDIVKWVAGLAVAIPIVVGAVSNFIASIELKFAELMVDVKALVTPSSPSSIFTQISNALRGFFMSSSTLRKFMGVDEDKYQRYEQLKNMESKGEEVIGGYENSTVLLQNKLGKYVDVSQYDLSTNEGRTKAINDALRNTNIAESLDYVDVMKSSSYLRDNQAIYQRYKSGDIGLTDAELEELKGLESDLGFVDTSKEAQLLWKQQQFAEDIATKGINGTLSEFQLRQARNSKYGALVDEYLPDDIMFRQENMVEALARRGNYVTDTALDTVVNLSNNILGETPITPFAK